MPEIKPRYEFRIWGESLEQFRAKLEELAPASEKSSEETYLISAVTERCNAKVRAELMDIKVLVAEERGLEQWNPTMKAEFPLPAATIADQVFPSLQLDAPTLSKAEYSFDEFLSQVIRPNPKIAIVAVTKTRYQFRIGVCAAEYSGDRHP